MLWRLVVVVGVLALSSVLGLVWQRRTGRFRKTTPATGAPVTPATSPRVFNADALGAELGSRATLVQFSSAFCAPCRATRVVLADVAGIVPGVTHIEIDAESHLDLVRELHVLSTPTVFVLDSAGAVVSRATGLPTRQLALAALASAMPPLSQESLTAPQ